MLIRFKILIHYIHIQCNMLNYLVSKNMFQTKQNIEKKTENIPFHIYVYIKCYISIYNLINYKIALTNNPYLNP